MDEAERLANRAERISVPDMPRTVALSPRELKFLAMLARGYTKAAIGREWGTDTRHVHISLIKAANKLMAAYSDHIGLTVELLPPVKTLRKPKPDA